MSEIGVRALQAADWEVFRTIRLEALRTEPGVFSAKHDVEAAQDQAWWEVRMRSSRHQVFGAFASGEPVGTIGAFTWNEDPSGATAILAMLFVRQGSRGQGVTGPLFSAALDWARGQPGFRQVVVAHRASNIASMRSILRHGFAEVRREPHVWPDGSTEDEVGYVLALSAKASSAP